MNSKNIIIGETYRRRMYPNYGFIKPIKILKPREGANNSKFIVAECELTIDPNDTMGLIRYYRPIDIVKCK